MKRRISMMQKMTKQLGMLLSFLLIFAQVSLVQPLISDAVALNEAVTITALDSDGEKVIDTKAVEFQDGDTAWDMLEEEADQLEFDESEWGKMLHGINGVKPDFEADGHFWGFFINGQAASAGLDAYDVKHGDNILLVETDSTDAVGKVTVSAIDDDGNEFVKKTEVGLASHATAHDAILQAVDDVDVSVDDQFFSMINNINDYEMADNQWWELLSNGEALQVGALSHQVQPGEHIQLRLQSFDDGSSEPEDEPEEDDAKDENSNEDSPGKEESDDTPDKDKVDQDKNEESEKKETSGLSDEAKKQIDEDIEFLTNKFSKENLATKYGHEWEVWGLGVAGKRAPESYFSSIEKLMQDPDENLEPVTELEKVIIALSVQGFDATDIAGYDLIERLNNHDGLTVNISSAIYALIAINSGEYEMDDEKEAEIIQYILDQEVADGGWTYFGDTPSVDITGMALTGLAPYKDNPEVKEKIDRAVSFLSESQAENGGYYEELNGGYTSEAAAQAIIGLSFIGIDATSEAFTKEEGNLIDYLLEFRADDGYLHILDDKETNLFPNQQALLALAYYKDKMLGEGQPTPKPNQNNEGKKPKDDSSEMTKDDDEKGTEDTKHDTSSTVGAGDDEGRNVNSDILPKTATDVFNYIAVGLAIVVIGIMLLIVQKRRNKQ